MRPTPRPRAPLARALARLAAPLVALCVSLLTACGDPSGSDAGPWAGDAGPPRLEVGTGLAGYVELPDGATLELIAGPQGGFHVFVSTRIYGLDVEGLVLAYEIGAAEGGPPRNLPTEIEVGRARLVREGDHWLRAGDFVVLDVEDPSEVAGLDARIVVRATEASGRSVTGEAEARIVDEVDERM